MEQMIDTGVLFTGGIGAAAWAAAGWQGVRQWRAGRGRHAAGVVTQVSAAARGGGSSVVAFVDDDGVPRRMETNFQGAIGQKVRVGYPVGRPQDARRVGGLAPWGFTVMGALVGGAFLSTAASLLLIGTLPSLLTGR